MNRKYTAVGIGLGICFGAALGAVVHHVGVGVALGICAGVAFRSAFARKKGEYSS